MAKDRDLSHPVPPAAEPAPAAEPKAAPAAEPKAAPAARVVEPAYRCLPGEVRWKVRCTTHAGSPFLYVVAPDEAAAVACYTAASGVAGEVKQLRARERAKLTAAGGKTPEEVGVMVAAAFPDPLCHVTRLPD